jgi:methyltransferase
MTKEIIILNSIILFYILQRVSEMLISRKNEVWLKNHCGAIEVDPAEGKKMKIFHTLWFVSLIIEANMRAEFFSEYFSIIIYLILGLCLGIRFYTMEKLKYFWTIKIFRMKHQLVISDGLYKHFRHPNYLVVILEFIFLPLLFKAYFTMIFFSIINIFVLKKRITLEEEVLMSQSNYGEMFLGVKRFFPYLFLLVISSKLAATEVIYHVDSYKEALESRNYIKFEGESTKFGFVTTGFDGYAKDIKIDYEFSGETVKRFNLSIPVKGMDTDLDSRNEKMFNEIFNMGKFPEIIVKCSENLLLKEGEQTIDMFFTVREKVTKKEVKIITEKRGNKYFVSGETSLSIKELGLPDPSIVIAKVRDDIKLKFAVEL